jgi:hypothetical protein
MTSKYPIAQFLMKFVAAVFEGEAAGAGDPPPGSESVVAGAENFESGRGEAAETPGCFGAGRRKNKGRLRLIEFARDALHGAVIERFAIGYDGEGVAVKTSTK